jgi:heterogeneous nuclear ribonucleoprotein K
MKVYSECAPMSTERVCQMKGKSPDIVNCLREAIGLLESAPPKGMSRPYDPHNFDEFLSSQYGGFCNDKRGAGGPGGQGGFQANGGQRGGFQQNNMNRGGGNNFNNNSRGGSFSRNNSNDGNGFNDNGGYQNNGM